MEDGEEDDGRADDGDDCEDNEEMNEGGKLLYLSFELRPQLSHINT